MCWKWWSGEKITDKPIYYKLKFNDSAIFMVSLLSNLVNALAEGIYKNKCKYGDDNKKCEPFGTK